ncbi:MAG: sugar-transfer associated ATP-grasp domain-containing protein [Planctomycetota bacterium]|jgi:hypothetical protein
MMFLRRILYLGYYFKQLNWTLLRKFMRHTSRQYGVSVFGQWWQIITCSLRYNISLLEFYQFGFIHQPSHARATWAGTGTMYEFQRIANPPSARTLLSDKRTFYNAYKQYFRHQLFTLQEFEASPSRVNELLRDHPVLVCKAASGNCGRQVAFFNTAGQTADQFWNFVSAGKFDLVETFALQHPALNALSPSAVNTVRIFTCLDDKNDVRILGCRLRISVNCKVDNLAAGNLAAPIDEQTGVVSGPGVYSDITRPDESRHPVTGVSIVGFQIPFWPETLDLVRQAAKLHPQNRSIGWDIVITPEGPGLIEGNHDWCKLVWQLPVKRGLKQLLPQTK